MIKNKTKTLNKKEVEQLLKSVFPSFEKLNEMADISVYDALVDDIIYEESLQRCDIPNAKRLTENDVMNEATGIPEDKQYKTEKDFCVAMQQLQNAIAELENKVEDLNIRYMLFHKRQHLLNQKNKRYNNSDKNNNNDKSNNKNNDKNNRKR